MNVDIANIVVDANTTTIAEMIDAQQSLCAFICYNAAQSQEQFVRLSPTLFPSGVPNALQNLGATNLSFGNAYAADNGLTDMATAAASFAAALANASAAQANVATS